MKTGGVYDYAIEVLTRELVALDRGLVSKRDAERIAELESALNDLGSHMSYLSEKEIEAYRAETEGVAGECERCGGTVFHRPGFPGEYSHACS